MLKRRGIKVTQEFFDAVNDYRLSNGYNSWNKALVELASMGLVKMGYEEPQTANSWGGDRKGVK